MNTLKTVALLQIDGRFLRYFQSGNEWPGFTGTWCQDQTVGRVQQSHGEDCRTEVRGNHCRSEVKWRGDQSEHGGLARKQELLGTFRPTFQVGN